MQVTGVLAYVLVISYFVVERALRKGDRALSLQASESDRGSSQILWASGLVELFLLIITPTLNSRGIGYWDNVYVGWLGVLLMLSGLILRYWAATKLGEFYTRTLQVFEGQKIIKSPPYNVIRHPGYLGTFLLGIGAALALNNGLVLLIVGTLGIISRIYRINSEEKMLEEAFAEQYKLYSQRTWRLIPWIL